MVLYGLRPRGVAGYLVVAVGAVSLGAALAPCRAQEMQEREVRIMRAPGGVTIMRGGPANRAVLGVMLGEGEVDGLVTEAAAALAEVK